MQNMNDTKIDEATIRDKSGCGVMRKTILDVLKRDLHMSDKVDVLQGAMPKEQPNNGVEIAYFECIDNAEFENYEDAVADSSDSNSARKAYSSNPKPFYVKVTCTRGNFKAEMLEGKELQDAMKKNKVLYRVELG